MTGTFEGVGSLQFSPDNKHAYAFSGDIAVDAGSEADTLMLEFNTEGFYLDGILNFCEEAIAADNIFFRVFLNDVSIINVKYDSSPTYTNTLYPILIPPFTNVKIKWGCSSGETGTAWLRAKVGGAIEQENLESITDNNKWAKL